MKHKSKIWTIITHEYLTRVKSKGFIIGTILAPLGFIAIIGISVLVTIMSKEDTSKKLAIVDRTSLIGAKIVDIDTSKYFLTDKPVEELKKEILAGTLDGFFLIPEDFLDNGKAEVFTSGGGGLGYVEALRSNSEQILIREKLLQSNADPSIIKIVESGVSIDTKKVTTEGEKEDFTQVFAILGYVLGFAIYGLMFVYGAMVMRGVIEEKANRIIEVIASSASPFQIMMGKVLGIGMVGLTQVLFWLLLGGIVLASGGTIASMMIQPDPAMTQGIATQSNPNELINMLNQIQISPGIVIGFIFYFLIGYFIYSTLFAAVGSAVDQEQDAAQLQIPITIPIIIPILFITNIMANPDGTLAIVLSLIPFFTPILMIVRIAATDVPIWQIALSVVLTIGTFFICLWIASKIYRVGILMYGKKPSFKDLAKWFMLAK